MKKTMLILIASIAMASSNILPKNFSQCTQISFFNKYNTPLPINDNMQIIKKYSCQNNIIYIGIENRIPGILQLNVNNDTKNFMLTHLKIKGFKTAVYIDKTLQKGVIAIKLTDKTALKILFFGDNYKRVLNYIKNLNLKKIKEEL